MTAFPPILSEGRLRGVCLVAALAVGQAAAAGVAAFATRDVFAALSAAEAAPLQGLLASLALIAGAGAAIALLRVAERAVGENVGQSYAAALRKTLFRHLTRMPAGEVARRRGGALAIRFIGDLGAVKTWVSLGVARLISTAIVLPGAIAALVLLNPALAAAAALPLAVSLLVMALLAPRLKPLHRRLRSRRARLAADMAERIPVAPELRLLGRDGRELDRLDARARDLRKAAVARARASASLRAVPEIGAAVAGVLLLGTAFVIGTAAAEAAGALAVLAILSFPLRDLAAIWDRRRAWEVARDKCRTILDAPVLKSIGGFEDHASQIPARLAFQNVGAGALRNLDAAAEPGQTVAIVGGNGAGKSTLLSLAAGLEHAASGRVCLDDADLRTLSQEARQGTIAYVGPRSPILKGSLRRALTLGLSPRPQDAVIEAAARSFGLGAVLERLGGLDGKLAEGGRNLSSGEARRVHLVRAALSAPRLLLLDEPDDALDREGRACIERLLLDSLATTFVVTHDLSLARRADVVWFVEGGELRAAGPPEEILERDGAAASLFRPLQVA